MFYRGDNFRLNYSCLGEVRSLVPSHVHVMALTATASKASRATIIFSLGMKNTCLIAVHPHKKNIFYAVKEKVNMKDLIKPLANALVDLRTHTRFT